MTQPEPADDLPVMRIDNTRLESWARHLVTASGLVREVREQLGRRRFSDAEETALDHDQTARSATAATVRPLTDTETRQWQTEAARAEQHTATDPAADRGLRVRVGPIADGRWAMDADIHRLSPDGHPVGDPLAAVAISCATEHTARELADELLTAGPDLDAVARIAAHSSARAARQAAAAGEVREPAAARLTRTREAIRHAWRPELAERVLASEAFPALAARLHQLEERGATMPEVLGRLSQPSLLGPKVRDPAKLAVWMCDNLLTVIDGELLADPEPARPTPTPRPRQSPAPSPGGAAPTAPTTADTTETGPPEGAVERDWRRAIAEDTVWPALRAALPEPLCHTLRGSRGYDPLVDALTAKHDTGWSLDALLAQLPTEKISQADDPARYLAGVLQRRARQSAPPRSGVDKMAMSRMVRDGLPPELAEQVLHCAAWPALAKRMAHAQTTIRRGDPSVTEMLRRLPHAAISNARTPAAYTAQLLTRNLAARHGQRPAPRTAHEPGTPPPVGELDPSSAIDRIALDDAPARASATTSVAAQPPSPDRPTAAQVMRAAEMVVNQPSSANERAFESLGLYGLAGCTVMDSLEALGVVSPAPPYRSTKYDSWDRSPTRDVLIGPDQLDQLRRTVTERSTHHTNGKPTPRPAVTAGPDLGAAASHQQASDDATRIADRDERAAGYEHLTAGPDTSGQDIGGQDADGLARLDDNLAAGARATAAEEADAAVAAALRAATVLTPPTPRTGAQPTRPRRDTSPSTPVSRAQNRKRTR